MVLNSSNVSLSECIANVKRAQADALTGAVQDPTPEHAVVFSCDEKNQIQALDRTQPGLPLKKGCCGTMTHDDKRNGTTSLFAALEVAGPAAPAFGYPGLGQQFELPMTVDELLQLRILKAR